MRIKNIALDDEGAPAEITVTMTRREAEVISRIMGRLVSPDLEEAGLDADIYRPAAGTVYDGLVGGVFNRFWDDGLDGALAGEAVE